ncbi:MAG: hypothetical protein VR75_10860 [Hyphomonadaceae bacterium BRH_c29]|nr:MAG: hypothetical protein VR75_10860 [Hyphomonadaceae bacterium BRH_c29]
MANKSIKIPEHDMEILRREAGLSKRSVGGQASHWMTIGRLVEQSADFSYQRVREALSGAIGPDALGGTEQDVFVEEIVAASREGTPEQAAFFRARRAAGLGVGLDDSGKMVRQDKTKAK